ncbi:MAG: hypothetical protein H0X25_11980 [Acidobacteriales bacterium]|nr:hypothetical protein [Terriglobales bacterium]
MRKIDFSLRFAKAVMSLAGIAICVAAYGQTYTPLYTFSINSGAYSGILPAGVMAQGRDGKLYSTISNGGSPADGTLFGMTVAGQLNTVYNFCSLGGCLDGSFPLGGATLGSDGNFYGSTSGGGTKNVGTVFKVNPTTGQQSTLWNFDGGTDGGVPSMPLLQAQDGSLWRASAVVYSGTYGAAYKVTTSGTLTPYAFNYTNGATPNLFAQGTDGNFYGSTRGGGSKGFGVVYKLSPSGVITVLHNFLAYPTDGNLPVGILVQGNDGSFYGTTYSGGAHNFGTVYKISASGTFTLLYSFAAGISDGAYPYTGLTLGTDGNLYGSTANGGYSNAGILFKITPTGTFTLLHSFCSISGCAESYYPETPLVQHTNGKFYGNTTGNSLGGSEFFSLDVGLKAFAKLVNWSGKVGKTVELLGQGFTGTTSVTFNGTAATFTVVSDTYMTAIVPSGATTGFVDVVRPGQTLKSDRKFLVTPAVLSFNPASGAVGTTVVITGTSFTGATKVSFGGVRDPTYTVDSDSQITATVPAGAKTGRIQVTTPGGTGTSATDFVVNP